MVIDRSVRARSIGKDPIDWWGSGRLICDDLQSLIFFRSSPIDWSVMIYNLWFLLDRWSIAWFLQFLDFHIGAIDRSIAWFQDSRKQYFSCQPTSCRAETFATFWFSVISQRWLNSSFLPLTRILKGFALTIAAFIEYFYSCGLHFSLSRWNISPRLVFVFLSSALITFDKFCAWWKLLMNRDFISMWETFIILGLKIRTMLVLGRYFSSCNPTV